MITKNAPGGEIIFITLASSRIAVCRHITAIVVSAFVICRNYTYMRDGICHILRCGQK